MPRKQTFPSFSIVRLVVFVILLGALLTLGGCTPASGTIDAETPGIFNHYVIYPLSQVIGWTASLFNDNFGIAIMIITIVIRLVLFPLMLKQYRAQQAMKVKMAAMKPELKELEAKYKGKKDQDSITKRQEEMMKLYSKHQVNPLAMGCLPMLIQLPILTGLYSAIRLTPELSSHSFLWFKLGEPDILLPIIAAVVYFIQFKVSQQGNESEQMKQLALLGYLSPILMGAFAMWAPAAISLYWVTGGLFMIVQSYLLAKLYPTVVPTTVSKKPVSS
ncbi:membrane protein insertase YidC [Paenibacillus sp. GSMTC-2017]|uniref:membrane protein insertase YidC n=1 Tax=Paenibacillus sp. GSMTC-2017 TaxID=2794350 RepID=UPI0018D5B8C4|nr:membrane protein insertase YidC [Paenibacillus sp. GSMTC-2017]MBH5319795.1 membrane protein insertase YidC [Paenibacillus sp. GSMTC-2017]